MITRSCYLFSASRHACSGQLRIRTEDDLWLNNAITSQRCWDVNMAMLGIESLTRGACPAGGALPFLFLWANLSFLWHQQVRHRQESCPHVSLRPVTPLLPRLVSHSKTPVTDRRTGDFHKQHLFDPHSLYKAYRNHVDVWAQQAHTELQLKTASYLISFHHLVAALHLIVLFISGYLIGE